jgi:large conductance mechanosensitive channel
MGMLKEFKAFVLRGNVVDLAVGVVIGAAFGTIVKALVENVLTPLLGLLNVPDFGRLSVEVGKDAIQYGVVLNALVSFVLIAAAVFFFVVKPVNRLTTGGKPKEDPKMKQCPHCVSSIPDAAKVCSHCTRELTRPTSRKTTSGRRR